MTKRLRIAIQKSGRLSDDSLALLRRAGCKIQKNRSNLFFPVENLPIDLLLVRDDDIPGFVSQGVADVGIVGLNEFNESKLSHDNIDAQILMELGFATCRLDIAIPETMEATNLSDINDLTIATSYPATLRQFLVTNKISANIVEMRGAIEVAPKLEIADIICDLVSTGTTLKANGLRSFKTVMNSQAVLLKTSEQPSAEKQNIIETLMRRFEGIKASRETKYVMLNAPRNALEAITKLLPGTESPTIIPLSNNDDMVAVHAVCRESVFWETLEGLKAAGASSILIMPIEKMMA